MKTASTILLAALFALAPLAARADIPPGPAFACLISPQTVAACNAAIAFYASAYPPGGPSFANLSQHDRCVLFSALGGANANVYDATGNSTNRRLAVGFYRKVESECPDEAAAARSARQAL